MGESKIECKCSSRDRSGSGKDSSVRKRSSSKTSVVSFKIVVGENVLKLEMSLLVASSLNLRASNSEFTKNTSSDVGSTSAKIGVQAVQVCLKRNESIRTKCVKQLPYASLF